MEDDGAELPAAYIGYTGGAYPLDYFEQYAFMDKNKRNSILAMKTGDRISPEVAEQQLGFDSFMVYWDQLMTNSSAVEALLQARMHHLPLGARLWQRIGAGNNHSEYTGCYTVFFTFSFLARMMFRSGNLFHLTNKIKKTKKN